MKLDAALIEGFVGSVLSKNFDQRVRSPECHREWWALCTSEHKFVAIAAPRAHAKSTAITHCYVLASVLFRDRSFVVIVSDTETQAVFFLNDIKKELQENEELVSLFGISRFVKDAESDIIVEFKDGEQFRIVAKGSEQKIRGLKWDGQRPDLIVCDDLENDEIVLNQERREKFKRWFYGALLPCRSDRGIVRVIGTILHLDSLLERLMPPDWSKFTVHEPLKSYSIQKDSFAKWKSVRYRAHNEDYSHILWSEKFSSQDLRDIRQQYVEQGIPDVYSQEYLNYPIDESLAYFKKSDFVEMREADYENIKSGYKELNYYIAGDLAISEKERADYSAFVVGGLDSENKLYILDVIRGRFDGRQLVDIIIDLQRQYDPQLFVIEKEKISKSIGPFLREAMFTAGVFPIIEEILPSVDKETRGRSIQGRMRVHGVRFAKKHEWYGPFEAELLTFPRGRTDDQVDAFAYLGLALDKFITARSMEERRDEEFEEERKASEHYEKGRSKLTGY